MATMFKILIRDGIILVINPSDDILESLFQMRRRQLDQLNNVLARYEPQMNQNLSKLS